MEMLSKRLIVIITVLFCSLVTCIAHTKIIDKILVIVNNDVITKSDLEERLRQAKEQMRLVYNYNEARLNQEIEKMRSEILQLMIDELLFTQEAMKNNIQVPEDQIQEELDKIRKQYKSDEEFEKDLKSIGYTIESWKREKKEILLRQALIRQKFESQVRVSDEEVRKFFRENKEQFSQISESILLRHIFIKFNIKEEDRDRARQKAQSILERCKSGEDFTEIIRELSKEPNSGVMGGDMGYFIPGTGRFAPELEEHASKLAEGEISDLINGPQGFDIIKVTNIDKKTGAVRASRIHIMLQPSQEEEMAVNEKVNQVLSELQKGAQFAELVRKYSDDIETRGNDGIWAEVSMDKLPLEIRNAFKSLEKGEVSQPVRTPQGIHIFQIADKQELSKEQIEQIRSYLVQRQLSEKLIAYSEKLRNNAYIRILAEN